MWHFQDATFLFQQVVQKGINKTTTTVMHAHNAKELQDCLVIFSEIVGHLCNNVSSRISCTCLCGQISDRPPRITQENAHSSMQCTVWSRGSSLYTKLCLVCMKGKFLRYIHHITVTRGICANTSHSSVLMHRFSVFNSDGRMKVVREFSGALASFPGGPIHFPLLGKLHINSDTDRQRWDANRKERRDRYITAKKNKSPKDLIGKYKPWRLIWLTTWP